MFIQFALAPHAEVEVHSLISLHWNPFPVYPELHVHTADPVVSSHTAFASHGLRDAEQGDGAEIYVNILILQRPFGGIGLAVP